MNGTADLETVNRTLAATVRKQEEELKQARADYQRLRSRMVMWSNAIKMAQDNERKIERLRAALERAAVYFDTLNKPAYALITRAALTAQPAEGEKHD